jgi:hypothetical protein
VSIYADPEFGNNQMEQIKEGLLSGVDVTQYADPVYSPSKMREIRKKLEEGS